MTGTAVPDERTDESAPVDGWTPLVEASLSKLSVAAAELDQLFHGLLKAVSVDE